ncbi:fimbria/pilus periplasmic chaperone [Pseudomonas sp. NFXW11]
MCNLKKNLLIIGLGLATLDVAHGAIALDRTRIVFNGGEKSVSVSISNQNPQLPYLAQAWLENEDEQKINGPLAVLPPIQRLEAGGRSQVKIQGLAQLNQLPQDRESLFYFNLREIPPRSDKANSLQIALQTRIKLFYRPAAIVSGAAQNQTPWQERVTLSHEGERYVAHNPTAYYVTLIDARVRVGGPSVEGFQPLMLAPGGRQALSVSARSLGAAPVLTYVNDFGGRPQLEFRCKAGQCVARPVGEAG